MKKAFLLLSMLVGLGAISFKTSTTAPFQYEPKYKVGDVAPEIIGISPEGKTLKLSSLKGKVVLIDFWASWCGPCRAENPNVVAAYNSFNNKLFKQEEKGFTVFNISLDNQKDNWVNAIASDGLAWPNHVSDLKGWRSDIGAAWAISSIPTNYLIDGNRKIIGVNLRGDALSNFLKNYSTGKTINTKKEKTAEYKTKKNNYSSLKIKTDNTDEVQQESKRSLEVKEICQSWIGKSKNQLLQSWGPPTKTDSDGAGGEILTFKGTRNRVPLGDYYVVWTEYFYVYINSEGNIYRMNFRNKKE